MTLPRSPISGTPSLRVTFLPVLLLCLPLLIGCASRRAVPVGPEVSIDDRQSIVALLREREMEISSGRLLALVESTSLSGEPKNPRGHVRAALVFKRPDRFRLELLPIGAAYTLQLLVSDDNRSTLLLPGERRAIVSSSADGGLLRAALKLPLSESDLATYLLGRMPARFIDRVSDPKESLVSRERNADQVRVSLSQFKDTFIIDRTSGLITEALLYNRFTKSESVALTAAYSPPDALSQPRIPRTITLTLSDEETTLRFDVQRSVLNNPIPDTLFSIQVPEDYSVIRK